MHNDLKKVFYGKLQRQVFSISKILLVIILFKALFLNYLVQAYPGKDHFYIPDVGLVTMNINGATTDAEWQNANWFTFGTDGSPEVTVKGQCSYDMLYLAFRIYDDDINNQDQLAVCIDPNNTGTASNINKLLKYVVFCDNAVTDLFINTGTGWDLNSSYSLHFSSAHVTSSGYWDVEMSINCSSSITNSLGIDKANFGLYFQVIDYIASIPSTPYCWPIPAGGSCNCPNQIPVATEWANGSFCQPCSTYLPDLYFIYTELKTNNKPPLVVKIGQPNAIVTKVYNRSPYNHSTVLVTNKDLQFLYSDFGVNPFNPIGNVTISNIPQPPQSDHAPATYSSWIPSGSNSTTVTIRAKLLNADDAITCNNIIDRNMNYIEVIENKSYTQTASVTNTSSSDDESFLNNKTVFYASSTMFPLQTQQQDTIFFYLNRSGLDPTIPDSVWDIRFIPVSKQDSLIVIEKDRYKLGFEKKAKKYFQLQFTAPEYDSSMELQNIHVKVYREREKFIDQDSLSYQYYETLGYFGLDIKVLPQENDLYRYLLFIIMFILIILGYFAVRRYLLAKTDASQT